MSDDWYAIEKVRCSVCKSYMEAKDELLSEPFYMCGDCWKDYWKALSNDRA